MKNGEVLKEIYNTICYKVRDEHELIEVSKEIRKSLEEHEWASFNEPDMDNETTAFVVFTRNQDLFKGLRLA
jgi:hypothetical protein